jgi:hypothetical protein
MPREKDPAAVALGRRGAVKRWANTPPEKRLAFMERVRQGRKKKAAAVPDAK